MSSSESCFISKSANLIQIGPNYTNTYRQKNISQLPKSTQKFGQICRHSFADYLRSKIDTKWKRSIHLSDQLAGRTFNANLQSVIERPKTNPNNPIWPKNFFQTLNITIWVKNFLFRLRTRLHSSRFLRLLRFQLRFRRACLATHCHSNISPDKTNIFSCRKKIHPRRRKIYSFLVSKKISFDIFVELYKIVFKERQLRIRCKIRWLLLFESQLHTAPQISYMN